MPLRIAFCKVAPLPADIAPVGRRIRIGRARSTVARGVTRQRDGGRDVQEDREVPVRAQFGTMQEDAVDDQRGRWRRYLFERRDRRVAAVIEMFCDVAARTL